MRGTIAKRLRRSAKVLYKYTKDVENCRKYIQHRNGRITIFWSGERRIYKELKKAWKHDKAYFNFYFPDGFSINTTN